MSERAICLGSLLRKGQTPETCLVNCPLRHIARVVTTTLTPPGVDLIVTLERAHRESQDPDSSRPEFAQMVLDHAGGEALAALATSNPRRSVTECPLVKEF